MFFSVAVLMSGHINTGVKTVKLTSGETVILEFSSEAVAKDIARGKFFKILKQVERPVSKESDEENIKVVDPQPTPSRRTRKLKNEKV